MATAAENITTRIAAIALELATTDWGPDVSDQGRSIQLTAYRMSLLEELKQLQELEQQLSGPFTVIG